MEIQLPPFCKKNLSLSFIWTFLIAPENYYNLSLIFEKIGFPFSSDQNIKFVADYKLREAIKNTTYFEYGDHRGELINWVLQKSSTLIGQLATGTVHICDWLTKVKQIYEPGMILRTSLNVYGYIFQNLIYFSKEIRTIGWVLNMDIKLMWFHDFHIQGESVTSDVNLECGKKVTFFCSF